jgi:cytochrome c2
MSCAAGGLAALSVASLIAAGCGKGGSSTTQAPPPPAADTSATASATIPATSPYDVGPRAGEGAIDQSQVKKGELLFTSKGCTVCHGFGKKITCPDLDGVTMRRTAAWMEQQILHPEVMTKQDPIAHELFVQNNKLQMTNQGLKPEEARAVIEFLKNKNKQGK